jgi:hypothetical protein
MDPRNRFHIRRRDYSREEPRRKAGPGESSPPTVLNRISASAILLAHAGTVLASPEDTTPSQRFLCMEHDVPGIYHGELRAADLNRRRLQETRSARRIRAH